MNKIYHLLFSIVSKQFTIVKLVSPLFYRDIGCRGLKEIRSFNEFIRKKVFIDHSLICPGKIEIQPNLVFSEFYLWFVEADFYLDIWCERDE